MCSAEFETRAHVRVTSGVQYKMYPFSREASRHEMGQELTRLETVLTCAFLLR